MKMNPMKNPNSHFHGNASNRCTAAAAWSRAEDMIFEDALVNFPEGVADRWRIIAYCLPGKSVHDVMVHYEALLYDIGLIDSGRVEIPGYSDEKEERVGSRGTGRNSCGSVGGNGKRTQCERKKGRPWTVEEHRLFLHGLEIYGKSDWRSISRNVVMTRLPSQVASHAQKYFNRLKSATKQRKRSSIHDITTAADCFTVPQSSSIHNIPSVVNCLTIPQRSSIHDITSAVNYSTVLAPANPPIQDYFPDFSFSM